MAIINADSWQISVMIGMGSVNVTVQAEWQPG